MKELKLTRTEEINLRSHHSIQYATTEHLENKERVMIDKIGICEVKTGGIKGLVTLKIVQKQWMYTRDGKLIKKPEWSL